MNGTENDNTFDDKSALLQVLAWPVTRSQVVKLILPPPVSPPAGSDARATTRHAPHWRGRG